VGECNVDVSIVEVAGSQGLSLERHNQVRQGASLSHAEGDGKARINGEVVANIDSRW
jgi:hypothetical protein